MNALLLALAIGTLAQAKASTPPAAPDLQQFDSPEGRFKVMLPGTPRSQHLTLDSPFGRAEMNAFLVEKSTSEAYGVVFIDYPKEGQVDADKILETARDEQVAGVKGKLLESRDYKVGSVPGRSFEYEFTIADGTKLTGRTRIFLLKKRLYQVGVIGTNDIAWGQVATKFLNSFDMGDTHKPASRVKPNVQAKRNRARHNEEAALRALDDPEIAAKIDKIRADQS
jgi:hypothetical protein